MQWRWRRISPFTVIRGSTSITFSISGLGPTVGWPVDVKRWWCPSASGAAAEVLDGGARILRGERCLARPLRRPDARTEGRGLLRLDGTPGAEPPDIIPGIAGHLVAPMPVYIEMWWSEHDRANCAWVDLVSLEQTLADRNVSASLPGTARCQLPKRLPLSPGCDLLYSLYA